MNTKLGDSDYLHTFLGLLVITCVQNSDYLRTFFF